MIEIVPALLSLILKCISVAKTVQQYVQNELCPCCFSVLVLM